MTSDLKRALEVSHIMRYTNRRILYSTLLSGGVVDCYASLWVCCSELLVVDDATKTSSSLRPQSTRSRRGLLSSLASLLHEASRRAVTTTDDVDDVKGFRSSRQRADRRRLARRAARRSVVVEASRLAGDQMQSGPSTADWQSDSFIWRDWDGTVTSNCCHSRLLG